jgi:hypothetical protein
MLGPMSAPTPSIGGLWLTEEAERWRDHFRPKRNTNHADRFNKRILHYAKALHSPKIGVEAVLRAALDLGLYRGKVPSGR